MDKRLGRADAARDIAQRDAFYTQVLDGTLTLGQEQHRLAIRWYLNRPQRGAFAWKPFRDCAVASRDLQLRDPEGVGSVQPENTLTVKIEGLDDLNVRIVKPVLSSQQ